MTPIFWVGVALLTIPVGFIIWLFSSAIYGAYRGDPAAIAVVVIWVVALAGIAGMALIKIGSI